MERCPPRVVQFSYPGLKKVKCDGLHELVPLVQFKKREKHPWKSFTFNKVAGSNTSSVLKATLPHECFPRFLNYTMVPNRAKHHK